MDDRAEAWDRRIAGLLRRLPARVSARIVWLRHPDRRLLRLTAGILLVIGGCLSILPVLGIWMLPLGLALIAEDSPGLKPRLESAARFCERLWHKLAPRSARRTPL
ncbi:hypothetical protein [Enterovirga rhinocerotis]|uniref:Uncharacterized protein n=1 Tax=Enterovirga rhinocerotis TaxID=1339210 RepID=A0A4R7BU73_9HYPH|nr:hypothetical protein [Enterovirga rhinocerotis]TDR89314.1 hypothetical protein EV668_3804 [Enterovirga rhinocerotis]